MLEYMFERGMNFYHKDYFGKPHWVSLLTLMRCTLIRGVEDVFAFDLQYGNYILRDFVCGGGLR